MFLQPFFLALYISKTTPDELPYTSSFSKSPSSHHAMFSPTLCPTTSALHPSGSLNEISSGEFYAWQFFGFFFPRDETKQGQSRHSLQMSNNKFKSCFGHVEFSWPSHEGCMVRYVLPRVSAEQAETRLHSPWATCSFNLFLFLPTKYAAKHLFIRKRNLVCVCFYVLKVCGTPILSKEAKPEKPMAPLPLAMEM